MKKYHYQTLLASLHVSLQVAFGHPNYATNQMIVLAKSSQNQPHGGMASHHSDYQLLHKPL